MDPATNPTVANALQQIQSQLDDTATLGEGVLNQMIDNILIKQEANRMDITVTSDEIESNIKEALGYTPDGKSTPTITPTGIIYPTLNPTQLVLFPPSATPSTASSSTPSSTSTMIPTSNPDTPATINSFIFNSVVHFNDDTYFKS